MAIDIEEKFEVEAPLDVVWKFLVEPDKIVGCLPGAKLLEVVDDRNFLGQVKVKLGAVTAAYKGKIEFQDVDAERNVLVMLGEGKDPSGGTARAEITVRLAVLESGSTEMTTVARIDLTGKVMQVGGGMIKGVSHQLFQRFAKSAKQQLEQEVQSGEAPSGTAGSSDSVESAQQTEALSIVPLLLQTIGAAIASFFRRLFGGDRS